MALEPDHLISFARVAQQGSVSRAAATLHRSQPAVSLQLRHLNEAVGEPLYQRHRYGVTLTPAGEALLPYAQALERALAGARRVASEIRGLERGTLGVSASMTVAVYLLPRLLALFQRHHPQLELRLLTRNSDEVLDLLARGDIEVAFVETPVTDVPAGMEQRIFFKDEVVLAARPDHPLAARGRLRPAELQGLPVVTRESGSGTRRVVELALAASGVELATVLEATGIEATKEAILQGLGPGFISRLAVQRETAAGLLVELPIRGLNLKRPMTLLHPAPELCSGATRAFLAFLQAHEDAWQT
jgi:DNA-binding transcriptional LysR family regulator